MTTSLTNQIVPQSAKELEQTPVALNRLSVQFVRMLERAATLHEDGYRASEILSDLYKLTTPEGKEYTVDLRDWNCTCAAYKRGYYTDTKGRTSCKHICGCRQLLSDQSAEAKREAFVLYCFQRVEYLEGRQDDMPEWNETGYIAFGHPAQEVF